MTAPLLDRITALMQRRTQRDRREVKRLAPLQRTLCHVQLEGETTSVVATVQNLSLKGIGLLSPRMHPLGSVLSLLLVNASSTFALAVEMTVVRTFPAADNRCFLGGPFTRPLLHGELVPFLI
jgi:hypothetical protein